MDLFAHIPNINIEVESIAYVYRMYCVRFLIVCVQLDRIHSRSVRCANERELATGGPGQINMCTSVEVDVYESNL